MVAIIGGNGLGTQNTSKAVLGQQGTFGNAATGSNKESAYLNVMTGNLSLQDSDDFLASHGINVELTRMYNSQGAITNDFGANGASWKYGMNRKVVVVNPAVALNTNLSQVALTEADGSVTIFPYAQGSNPPCYLTRDGGGAYKRLTWVPATGEWICRQDNAVNVNFYDVYDSTHGGRLVRTFERNAAGAEIVRQRYIYDDTAGVNQGRLIQVTDASGASGTANGVADATGLKDANGVYTGNDQTHFDYDPVTGDLRQIRSVLANGSTFIRTRYGYDNQHRLKTVTVDLTPDDGSVADNNVYTTSYEYDPVSKGVSRVSQSDGSELRFTYVLVGGNYRVDSFTDALQRKTSIDYSVANKPMVTDPLGVKTTYTFDANGNLSQIDTLPPDSPIQTTKFFYEAVTNNLTQITHPDGANSWFVANQQGNLKVILDQAGNQVTDWYDNNIANGTYNKLLNHVEYTGKDTDGPGTAVAPSGPAITRYVYDAASKVHYKLSPQGGVTEYLYYANGDLMSELRYNGGLLTLGGETAVVGDAAVTAALAAVGFDKSNISRTDYVYDARGLLAKSTRYAKVDANRLGVADGAESVSYFTYDQAGQLLLTRDGGGNQTTYTYDGLGRVLTRTDANKTLFQSIYDAKSNLTVTTTVNGDTAPSSTTSYVRNGAGQLLSVQLQYGTRSGITTYTYDDAGQLRRSTDPSGKNTYWLYDALGRKRAQIEHNGVMTEYAYNKLNQLTKTTRYATAVDPATLTDAQGKPADVTVESLRPAANAADRSNWTDYDAIGTVIATVDNDGYLTRYVYTAMNRVTQTIVRAKPIDTTKLNGLDIAAAYPGEATAEDRVTRVLHLGDQIVGKLDELGYLTEYKYDAGGRLIDTISYDTVSPAAALAAGDLNALRPAPNAAADRHERKLYNGRDQLIATIDADNYVTEFRYDGAGNLSYRRAYSTATAVPTAKDLAALGLKTSPQDQITSYTYTALNKLATETSATGAYTKYGYDADGNVTSIERGTASVAEMTSASRYDGAGHLIGQLNDEGVARLAALGATPAPAAVAALWAGYAQTYVYNNAGQRISATDVYGNRTLYFYDAMGRLTHTVNPLGEVQEQRYDNFGQVIKTIQYGKRLSTALTASLAGGKPDALFTNAMLALADISLDRLALFYYDDNGRLSYSIDSAGGVKGISYNAFGQLQASVTYAGALGAATLTALTGGTLGNQLSAQGDAGDNAAQALAALIATTANSRRNVFYYDAAGHLTYSVDALGQVSGHVYNTNGKLSAATTVQYAARLTPATLTGSAAEINAYAKANATNTGNTAQQYSYNRRGLVVDVADALTGGNHTLSAYDAYGNIIKNSQLGSANSITPAPYLDLTVQTAYDANGRVRATVDGVGGVIAYQYDSAGHVTDKIAYANVLSDFRSSTDIGASIDAALAAGKLSDPVRDRHQRFIYANGKLVLSLSAQKISSAKNAQGATVYTSTWAISKLRYDNNGRQAGSVNYARLMDVVGSAPTDASALAWADAAAALNAATPDNDAVIHDASTRLVYDAAGRLVATATAQRHEGGTVKWSVVKQEYDTAGNVLVRTAYANTISAVSPGDDAILAVAASATDAITRYNYDALNRVTMTAVAQGPTAVTDVPPSTQQWALTRTSYDNAGNVASRIQYATPLQTNTPPKDLAGAIVANAALDRASYFTYDVLNRLNLSIDAAGAVTQLQYDAQGNVAQRTTYALSAANPAETNVANYGLTPMPGDRITRTVYNLQHRPVYDIDALGHVTEYRYDVLGNKTASIRYAAALPGTAVLSTATSPADVKKMLPAAPGASDRTEYYGYDQNQRQTYVIDAGGYIKENVYNALGQLSEVRAYMQPTRLADPTAPTAVSAETLRQYQAGSVSVTILTYDASGNLSTSGDSSGATEYYGYDGLGRKTSYTNKLGSKWTYAYDAAGHLVLETSPQVPTYASNLNVPMGGWGDGNLLALMTRMEYDALGNLTKRTEGVGSGTERITEYRYDSLGRQVQTIRPAIDIYNDAADPKQSAGAADAYLTSSGARVVTVGYNAFGDAVSNQDVGGKFSYKVYDKRGQVSFDIDALGFVTGYGRDIFGNAIWLTRYNLKPLPLAGGKTPAQVDDVAFGATIVHDYVNDRVIGSSYDALNRVIKVVEPVAAIYDSHATGNSPQLYAAKTTETVYTDFGDVAEQFSYGADYQGQRVTDAADTRYAYDALGRKTQQLQLLSGARTASGTGYLTTYSYGYNAGNNTSTVTQLEYAKAVSGISAGAIPAQGDPSEYNRKTVSAYDRNSRLVSETRVQASFIRNGATVIDDIVTSYGYDALGRQTSVTDGLGGTTYTYFDALGRTIGVAKVQTGNNAEITKAGSPLTEFKLDVFGNAVLRIDYAKGAAGTPAANLAKPVDPLDGDNRVTASVFDTDGRTVKVLDAEQFAKGEAGSVIRTAYDVYGRAAKQWRTVTSNGALQTSYQITRYDALGRTIEIETPGNDNPIDGNIIERNHKTNVYNAFGEVTATYYVASNSALSSSATGQMTSYTRYDHAGRAWLSNAGDGIDRVTLFDAMGNATAQIVSTSKNQHVLQNLRNSDELNGMHDLLRTDMRYDMLGHMTDRSAPYGLDAAATSSTAVLQKNGDVWVPATLASDQVLAGQRIVLGTVEDAKKTFTIKVRSPGGDWTEVANAVQLINGLPTFDPALVGAPFEYQVYSQTVAAAGPIQTAAGKITIAGTPNVDLNRKIIGMYLMIMNRPPSANTLNQLIGQYNSGGDLASLAVSLLASPDVQSLLARGSIAFLAQLHDGILALTPDGDELERWRQQFDLAGGDNRGKALVDILNANSGVLLRRIEALHNYMSVNGGSNSTTIANLFAHADIYTDGAIGEGTDAATTERYQAQLTKLYVTIMGRVPDAGGLAYWVNARKAGFSLASIADSFFSDVEGQQLYPTPLVPPTGDALVASYKQFVSTMFRNLLHREPAVHEMDFYTLSLGLNQISRGGLASALAENALKFALSAADLQAIRDKVALSLAYVALPPPDADLMTQLGISRNIISTINAATNPANAVAEALLRLQAQAQAIKSSQASAKLAAASTPLEDMRLDISRLYVTLLGRAPDHGGYLYYLAKLTATPPLSLAELATMMLTSAEATGNAALYPKGLSDSDFVRRLYSVGFSGTPDKIALSNWVNQLANGATRGQVTVDLIRALVSGIYSAGANTQALFNNRVAVGVNVALNLASENVADATAILGLVTATDISAAVTYGLNVTKVGATTASAVIAQSLADASALNASAIAALQGSTAAATAAASAATASAANPLASGTLRAARIYAAYMNQGRTGSGIPMDMAKVAAMARAMAAGATDIGSVMDLLASSDGKLLYPTDNFDPAAFVTRMYRQVLNIEPPPAKLAYWSPRVAASRLGIDSVVLVGDMLYGAIDNTDPQAEAVWNGRVGFEKDLNKSLAGMVAQAQAAETIATQAKASFTSADVAGKNTAANTAATAMQTALNGAAANTVALIDLARLFVGVLNRGPGAGQKPIDVIAMNNYLLARTQGASLASIATQMLNTGDGQAMYAGVSDSVFINQIYQQTLGRPAGADEAGWLATLAGSSRGQVAAAIIDSVINKTAQLASEYTAKGVYDQRVATALAPVVSAAGAAATAAQKNVTDTLNLKNAATTVATQKATALDNAKKAAASNDAALAAAKKAAEAALYYQQASPELVSQVTETLVAFHLRTNLASVNAQIATLATNPKHLERLAALGVGATATSLNDLNAYLTSLYRSVLLREPDPGGFAFWLAGFAGSTDPGAVAYHFFEGARKELYHQLSDPAVVAIIKRNNFEQELSSATAAAQGEAKTLIDNYNAAVLAAAGGNEQAITQAQLEYDNAVADRDRKIADWNTATALAPLAQTTLAAANSAVTVQGKAVAADNTRAAALAASASIVAAAASVGLAPTATLADFNTVLANATAFKTALALEVTESAKLADVDSAAVNTVRMATRYAASAPTTQQAIQLTQMYVTLYGRAPTLMEFTLGTGYFQNGRSLADQANALIASAPTLPAATLTGDDFVIKLFTNAVGRAPADGAVVRLWSDRLKAPTSLSKGQLLSDLLADWNIVHAGSDALALDNKVAPMLVALNTAAKNGVAAPNIADFVAANAAASRDAAALADARAVSAMTPDAIYLKEIVQLYVILLGHAPDTPTLVDKMALRKAGTPLLNIAQTILALPEAQGRFPSALANADYVRALFQTGLGRAADAAEVTAWTGKLTSDPATRAQLAASLVTDLYAYAGNDSIKLTTQIAFMGRVSEALGHAGSDVKAADNAVTTLQAMQQQAVFADYAPVAAIAQTKALNLTPVRFAGTEHLTVDRWGNVLTVADARDANWKISYTYNYNNQQLSQTLNTLAGTTAVANSTGYDALGRQVRAADFVGNANSKFNTQRYDSNGNVVKEIHADGGVVDSTYDLFGNRLSVKRWDSDTSGVQMNYKYDHLGHLIRTQTEAKAEVYATYNDGSEMKHYDRSPQQLTEQFEYDELGRKTRNIDAAGISSYSSYDLDGNVISTMTQGNQYLVRNVYDAFHHRIATRDAKATNNTMSWDVDSFGRVKTFIDMSGTHTDYRYDGAGNRWLTSTNGSTVTQTYENGLLVRIVNSESGLTTNYTYDIVGNRLSEKQSYAVGSPSTPERMQDNTLTYDKQNRLTGVKDKQYELTYGYDNNGNRTSITTLYGGVETIKYNAYDEMNRQTVVNAQSWDVASNTGVLGKLGHQISYDKAGNRTKDSFIGVYIEKDLSTTPDKLTTESYSYDSVGRLQYSYRDGVMFDSRRYDEVGRITQAGQNPPASEEERSATAKAGIAAQQRTYSYDIAGHMTHQMEVNFGPDSKNQDVYFLNDSRNNIYGGYDAAGNMLGYTITTQGFDSRDYGRYQIGYKWTDSAREETVTQSTGTAGTTTSYYDNAGNRTRVESADPKLRQKLWYDADGHVQSKLTDKGASFTLIVNGQVLGEENGNADNILGSMYQPLNAAALTAPPSSYSVQSNSETLQSIAQAIWGDAKLWYLIADANGKNADQALKAGEILRIPSRVNTVHNDYSTFKPYNASDAIGNTAPALPPPTHGGGCGVVGQIVMVVVAVVVTAITAGTLGPVMAAALGSIASQVVGNAIGAQDGFSWKGVALAAVSAGMTEGVSSLATPSGMLSSISGEGWQAVAARAAVSNAATQGVANITGLQHGFSWASVAASAAGAVVSSQVSSYLGNSESFRQLTDGFTKYANTAASNFAGGLTTAVARGGKISVAQIATDAFGNALGSSLAEQVNDARTAARINSDQMFSGQEEAQIEKDAWATRSAPDVATAGNIMTADEVKRQVMLDILGEQARDDSLITPDMLQTGGPVRGAARYRPGSFEMVRNNNWDNALNLAADPFGLLGEVPGIVDELGRMSQTQAKGQVDAMREAMTKLGVKNVPTDYEYYISNSGSGIDFKGTAERLGNVYEGHVRDQRLRETWGDDYESFRVGKSKMTVLEFEKKVLDVHLQATDVAYTTGVDLIANGKLTVKDGQYARTLGNYIDESVRNELRGFAKVEDINDGPMSNIWAINRRIKSDSVAGYGIPDGRIGFNIFHDTTLARKDGYTSQLSKWNAIRPGNFLIIRPTELGGPYVVPRQSIQPYVPQPKLPGRKF
ncbi:DUF4214 domain-containing protein [Duganella sp. HH101]|uniref:DUF4214 domain-containing protein n=1 Tax=Duganella sp. HH101 TaxID=1781066 RepID=UPI0008932D30|nr:DUF4214 domain-containing protein [Duganella sp. HH101]OFA06690.1 tRNA(Glu)-specific nuclease WapA precursor [Duganella sp. HH101]